VFNIIFAVLHRRKNII